MWLNRSDLAEGERVAVYFNWAAGGEPYFRAGTGVCVSPRSHAERRRLCDVPVGRWPMGHRRIPQPGRRDLRRRSVVLQSRLRPRGLHARGAALGGAARQFRCPGPQEVSSTMRPTRARRTSGSHSNRTDCQTRSKAAAMTADASGPASGPSKFGPAPNSGGGGGPAEGASGGKSAECKRAPEGAPRRPAAVFRAGRAAARRSRRREPVDCAARSGVSSGATRPSKRSAAAKC